MMCRNLIFSISAASSMRSSTWQLWGGGTLVGEGDDRFIPTAVSRATNEASCQALETPRSLGGRQGSAGRGRVLEGGPARCPQWGLDGQKRQDRKGRCLLAQDKAHSTEAAMKSPPPPHLFWQLSMFASPRSSQAPGGPTSHPMLVF